MNRVFLHLTVGVDLVISVVAQQWWHGVYKKVERQFIEYIGEGKMAKLFFFFFFRNSLSYAGLFVKTSENRRKWFRILNVLFLYTL